MPYLRVALLLLAAAVVLHSVRALLSLQSNIRKAKASGLNYIIGPCSPFWIPWTMNAGWLMPILTKMGRLFPFQAWLVAATPEADFRYGHSIYAAQGEAYLAVSPFNILLLTDSPQVIHQITHQRERFPKNSSVYAVMEQFGPNVLSTEGAQWRMHRKVMAVNFNEKNAALVWRESIGQTQGLLEQWVSQTENRPLPGQEERRPQYVGGHMLDPKTITSLETDTMRLTLHIISYVGFGVTLKWPGVESKKSTDPRAEKYSSEEPMGDHTMTLLQSLASLLEYLFVVLLIPEWLSSILPIKALKVAAEANKNYVQYMNEILDERLDDICHNVQRNDEGMDLIGKLAHTYHESQDPLKKYTLDPKLPQLSRSDILGNIFIMMVAGHETTANALHFLIVHLAANPEAQRLLAADLDRIVGDSDPREWDYEDLLTPLLGSYAGACMNEILRIMPAITLIPKIVGDTGPQSISMNGATHVLPPGTEILLSAAAAAKHPGHWPSQASRISEAAHDLDDFVPQRWFASNAPGGHGRHGSSASSSDEDGLAVGGSTTSAGLFRPVRGSFVPFSDGPRSCLGRRIAQVEVIAALAVIFQKYSVELAVDEWATDVQVASMSADKKREVYKCAQAKFLETMKGARSVVTLKLHGGHVPVRFVKRGRERFLNVMG
ncbi:hypothetical protein TD95_004046 [Thielaviopsis punctulata]|uniref:Cytochrome P450 n=1 Tax=Thielaviopsis punctulata TaxID=72032 RepID=A0A0F4ZET2_9PEZI|nr:hypothetical protein TD95_004046 [Thielaviopsis punctulata]